VRDIAVKTENFLFFLGLAAGLGAGAIFPFGGGKRVTHPSAKVPAATRSENLSPNPVSAPEIMASLVAQLRKSGVLDWETREKLRGVTSSWLQADPVACLNWMSEHGLLALLDDDVVNAWIARSDPASILSVASRCTNALLQSDLASRLVYSCAQKDPQRLLDLIGVLPRHLQWQAVSKAAKRLAADHPREAFELLASNPYRGWTGLSVVVDTWAARAPADALQFVSTEVSDWQLAEATIDRERLLETCLDQLQRQSPEAALDALRNLQVDFSLERWKSEATGALIARHPENAKDWLARLPEGAAREEALAAAARRTPLPSVEHMVSLMESGVGRSTVLAMRARDQVYLGSPEQALQSAAGLEDPLGRSAP
jgi:hypothetical protein